MSGAAVSVVFSMRGSHPCGGRPTLPYSCVLPRARGALYSSCGAYCPAIRLLLSGGAFSFLALSSCGALCFFARVVSLRSVPNFS